MFTKALRLIGLVLVCLVCAAVPASATNQDNGDTIATAPVIAPETVVKATLDPFEWYFYRVDLNAGDTVKIDLLVGDSARQTCVYDYDPSVDDYNFSSGHTQLIGVGYRACTNENGAAELSGAVPVSGRWTLMVESCGFSCDYVSYGYQLVVHVTPATQPATPLPPTPKPKKPAKSPPTKSRLVVACCDSFASGEGTQSFLPLNARCHRTDAAWPNLLPYPVVNVACSGAKISALFSPFKGQQPQIEQMKRLHPGIIVMMDGGNDALYSAALRNCYRYNCTTGKLNQNFLAISTLRGKLAGALEAVMQAVPKTKLFLAGYPRVFPAYPRPIINCGWLNSGERLMLNALGNDLQAAQVGAVHDVNQALHLTGKRQVQFISTKDALNDHELCYYNSWMFKINFPACVKDSRCGHPTAPGQAAIASVIAPALRKNTG